MAERKTALVLAGPNGAGKTTSAGGLLADIGITEFVNADLIEREITTEDSGSQMFSAGRLMLERIDELVVRGSSFAFETTLASRTFVPLLRYLAANGYETHLIFVWLKDAETAIDRVAARVRLGGHNIPPDVIRRRYERGVKFSSRCTGLWSILGGCTITPGNIQSWLRNGSSEWLSGCLSRVSGRPWSEGRRVDHDTGQTSGDPRARH